MSAWEGSGWQADKEDKKHQLFTNEQLLNANRTPISMGDNFDAWLKNMESVKLPEVPLSERGNADCNYQFGDEAIGLKSNDWYRKQAIEHCKYYIRTHNLTISELFKL